MTIDDKIKDEKLQYNIYREIAKLSTSSSSKIEKQEILQLKKFYQVQILQQAKFTYYPL